MKWMNLLVIAFLASVAVAQEGPEPPAAPGAVEGRSSGSLLEGAGDVLEAVDTSPLADTKTGEAPSGNALLLDVRQCVEMALAQNARVMVADEDVAAAHARTGQARAQFMPQVKASSGYQRTNQPELGGMLGKLVPMSALTGDEEMRSDQLSISQVLFAGGQIRAAVKASKYLAESQEWQRQATLDALAYDAKQAYYDCLLAQALVQVAEESVITFQRHLTDAEQMFDVGMISQFEVLRAKTELGARKADAVAARNIERLALVNLRRVLFVPQDTEVRLVGELAWVELTATVQELVEDAWSRRPEVRALEAGIAASEQNVRRTRGQYLPRVAAGAEWTNLDGGGQMVPEGWTYTIGGEWELFSGLRRKNEVAEAKASLRSLEYQLEDVKRLVELDVNSAYIQVQDAIAKIRSEKGTVALGTEGLRLAELRFQEGVGTQAEILDAQLALTNAQTGLDHALREYAVAHAALEKALGTINPSPVE